MRGHTHLVKAVAVSPADGLTVASAGGDMSIILWDLRANPPRPRGQPLSGHTDTVQSVAFSPDGAVLASASSDHTIRLWDVASGRPMGSLLGHSATVWSVAFSPDGSLLASGSADGTVRLWDVTNLQPVSVLSGHAASVYDVAFSPDGALLASAGRDRTVRLWNVANRVADGDPLTEPDEATRLLSTLVEPYWLQRASTAQSACGTSKRAAGNRRSRRSPAPSLVWPSALMARSLPRWAQIPTCFCGTRFLVY